MLRLPAYPRRLLTCTDNTAETEASTIDLPLRFASRYDEDIEKSSRKFQYRNAYESFLADSKLRKMKVDHVRTCNEIWAFSHEKNEQRIEECKAEIKRLEEHNAVMEAAAEELYEKFADELMKAEGDEEVMGRFEAFFELASDVLEVKGVAER